MDPTRIIIGPVTTEKSERQKLRKTYTLLVHGDATKVDVKAALKRFYDVDAVSVRVLTVRAKKRALGAGREMTKRHHARKAFVTLSEKSKPLDLAQFHSVS